MLPSYHRFCKVALVSKYPRANPKPSSLAVLLLSIPFPAAVAPTIATTVPTPQLAAPLMRPRPGRLSPENRTGEAGTAGPGPISAWPSPQPVPPRHGADRHSALHMLPRVIGSPVGSWSLVHAGENHE
jgi:hypothetical protein